MNQPRHFYSQQLVSPVINDIISHQEFGKMKEKYFLTQDQLQDIEDERLAPYAMRSNRSKRRYKIQGEGREYKFRTEFQRDRDRIIHSRAFRRLKHKTQVFVPYDGDHQRTRLTHTIEVSQISRTIARALNLNEDLTEAIALGHDSVILPSVIPARRCWIRSCPERRPWDASTERS